MNVNFIWRDSVFYGKAVLEPACLFYENDIQIKLNLSVFLIDDEGLGLNYLQRWIKNGLNEIDKIKSGEISDFDMWGQSMGALISLEKVTVYCGDDFFPEEYMGFNAFYEILTRWLDFISTPVGVNEKVIFCVDMEK